MFNLSRIAAGVAIAAANSRDVYVRGLTVREAQFMLKAIGITVRWMTFGQEYRVNFTNGREATAAYEPALYDAVHTGFAMYNHYLEHGDAAR